MYNRQSEIRNPKYVEVAVGLPVVSTFDYRVPATLKEHVDVGKRVYVPFRNRQLLGFVVGFRKRPAVSKVKAITHVVDEEPVVDPHLLTLTRWMAETYQTPWGQTIQAVLPGPLRRGLLKMEMRHSEAFTPVVPTTPLSLSPEQKKAVEALTEAIHKKRHQVFLLHGITGSGKTEVYLQAIQEVLAQGQGAIVLVPEISLTPQTVERFQGRFGESTVAVLHSGMLESRRLHEWRRIRSGEARVVVGARSAVFAPVASLGLIVIDEEHEPSYKQEDSPRYHAREVALERGRIHRAPVLLGSATPSLETYYEATRGRYRLLELPQRIDEVPLPDVEIVDMRRELEVKRRPRIFSRALEEAIAKTLEASSQAILFLNRRGFSTFVQCTRCGGVLRCPHCQVTLTYHIADRSMICHYCRETSAAPQICPKCQGDYVRFRGTGTERVESELARLFPQARLARMDTDATQIRGSHAKILQAFQEHAIDILIGTQMVAKGLDFPRVTLVGVISADTALNIPDFRSSERTFHLLTQVAGRAGRGKLPGKVVIQTYAPHHEAIVCASRHDYHAFYLKEIATRKELHLPPLTRLVQMTFRSLQDAKALAAAQDCASLFKKDLPKNLELLGPAAPLIRRLRRYYRWQLILKAKNLSPIQELLSKALQRYRPPRGSFMSVDVDPL